LGRPKAFASVSPRPYIREVERIAMDTGRRGSVVPKKAGYGGFGEKYAVPPGVAGFVPLGKFEFRNGLECVVAGAGARAAQEGGREQRPVTA